ncbi:MAG: hypothetical protein HYV40_01290 [Candidatus Levybacteria bacterium]|nr:hypothetical protein [Candidatus Levybacteria bacterium]
MSQRNYKPHYEHLKNKWQDRHREIQKEILEKHGEAFHWLTHHLRNFSVGAVGVLLLSVQQPSIGARNSTTSVQEEREKGIDKTTFLVHDLFNTIPKEIRPLTTEEEDRITAMLSERFGFPVKAEIYGKRLNLSYGRIGAEQHLARYPGDTMATHFATNEDATKYYSSGMAPGLGAWRYFAPSRSEMTQKESDREKYYIAVQTFLAPGFHDSVREYSEFFKFRKMLVVNPHNGKAMVVVIGDAGPAEWTGKGLGGSPEVMKYLERVDGKAVGPVLYFFIDDPNDTIPLGPVEMK